METNFEFKFFVVVHVVVVVVYIRRAGTGCLHRTKQKKNVFFTLFFVFLASLPPLAVAVPY